MAGIFNSAIFNNAIFNVGDVTPSVRGGHFGFDEKKRGKRLKDELEAERERRETLKALLFGIPEAEQPVVAEQVFGVREVDDWTPFVDTRPAYEAALSQLKALAESIRQAEVAKRMREDDEDIEALIRLGAI